MKTYTIGRDVKCDIVINDPTDVISRKHAVLNVDDSGKMTITDTSSNGTYINGIRMTQNVPVPVTRKDTVSLAHIAKLDWAQIPEPKGSKMKWIIAAIILVVAVVAALIIVFGGGSDPKPTPAPTDSTEIKAAADSLKADSVAVPTDSVKAKTDSVDTKANTPADKKEDKKADKKADKKDDKKAADKKDADKKDADDKKENKEPNDTVRSRRAIG